jgi:nucleotide-binding universal stress UspA family protein
MGLPAGIFALMRGAQARDQRPQNPQTPKEDDPNPPRIDPKLVLEENQKEIKKSVEKLYDLASELKAEVEKTDSVHVLSVAMLRKTDEIEKLAKEIRSRAKG